MILLQDVVMGGFGKVIDGCVHSRIGETGTRVPITQVIRFDTHYPFF